MTHPLTPREKVELKPCPFCGGRHLKCLKVFSEDEPDHQIGWQVFCEVCHAHGPASVRIGWCETEADAEVAWNRLTALASGSGDHAELARLAEAATPGEWELDGHQCLSAPDGTIVVDYSCCSRGEWEANAAYLRAVQPSRTLALLAENAALRGANYIQSQDMIISDARATEAERKLAEAVGLLRRIAETPSDQFDDVAEADKIRTFLSKEAERG